MLSRTGTYIVLLFAVCSLFAAPESVLGNPSARSRIYKDSALVDQGTVIHISSQKGDLKIKRWDKSMIWVQVSITFENQDQKLAGKELKYARYNFLKSASEVNISNYFSLPSGINKIDSKVSVAYQIFIPDNVFLTIDNEYGSCTIQNTIGYLTINNKYGEIELENIQGNTRIFTKLCDISLNGFSGKLDLVSSNSDVELLNINGNATLETKNGTVSIEQGDFLDKLKLTSSYSKVDVFVHDVYRFNYSLSVRKAKFELGSKYQSFPFKGKNQEKLVYQAKGTDRIIDISANYNSVKLH